MFDKKDELKREYEERLRATELAINRFQGSKKSEMPKKLETFKADLLRTLDRIHTEDFGICADCKSPIALDRLLTRPDERRCLSCESRNK